MEWLELLGTLSVRGCVLFAVAAFAIAILQLRSAAARHAVWTAVLLGLFLQIPLHPLLPPLPLRVLRAPKVVDASAAFWLRPMQSRAPASPVTHWPPSKTQLALGVYVAGVLFAGLQLVAGFRLTRRITRNAIPLDGGTSESSQISVPMTTGWPRATILLPASWRDWEEPKRLAVLAHEQAHVDRRDWIIALVARVHRSLFWFHPLAWWLERQLANLAEHAADDAAIAHTGDRRRYAQTLIEIVQDLQAGSGRFLTAMAKSANVRQRIDAALDESRPSPRAPGRRFFATLATVALACIYFSSILRLAPAQTQAAPTTPYQKWLAEDVAYVVTEEEREAFQRLAADAEREMFIQQFWLRRDPTPGTVENEFKKEHYRRISYSNELFRTRTGLAGWKTDRGRLYIVFGPADEIESHPGGGSHEALVKLLGPLPGLSDDASPFEVWHYRNRNWWFGFVDKNRSGEYHIVEQDWPPRILTAASVDYTPGALSRKVEGSISLRVTIGRDGTARNAVITRSLDAEMDQQAILAARKWIFLPALKAGVPVEYEMELHFAVRLP